jgi:KDO2-lipid IV(A) lauroyltransferase
MPQSKLAKSQFLYRLQAAGAWLIFAFFGALPLDEASALGGWLARRLGPFTGAHRVAVLNLRRALKYKNNAEIAAITDAMWDNIGRTLAEYPHLGELMNDASRIEVVDKTNVAARLRHDGIGAILVGMHAGNWELSTVPGFRGGLKQHHFYRAPNNPFVDRLLIKMRAAMHQDGYLPKGGQGARQATILLKNHSHIGMLIDEKQDEGIAAPFFGRDAMTTTAPAAFARRFNVPIVADRVVRLKGARFRIYVEPVEFITSGDRAADVIAVTKQLNLLLENWIRQNPEQWFWVHHRWPEDQEKQERF